MAEYLMAVQPVEDSMWTFLAVSINTTDALRHTGNSLLICG